MDNGQIVEYDEPGVLLQDPNSLLKTMVERTGPSMSRKLYRIAMDKFEVKQIVENSGREDRIFCIKQTVPDSHGLV